MSPLLWKNDIIRLYPKKLNYLFLAVFAFFSPFCYAKTAFSYSPDILSPCTPYVTMVKNVVKSEYRMIDMWSCFQVVEALKNCSAGREEYKRTEKKYIESREKHSNRNMWSTSYHKIINMCSGITKQPRAGNAFIILLQVLYCNLELHDCQGLLTIKSALKIWYAVSKEKTRRDHFHHIGAKPSVHAWWIWSHFAFRIGNNFVRTQKLICIKQRNGGYGSNYR